MGILLRAEDTIALAQILSRYYHAPKPRERVLPPIIESVLEKKFVDETATEAHEVDGGPRIEAIIGVVAANAASLLLLTILDLIVVFALLLIVDGIGYWVLRKFRRTRLEEREVVRQVEREIEVEREVEPERVITEEVASKSKVITVGKGKIGFQATTLPVGVLVTGPPGVGESHDLLVPVLDEAVLGLGEPLEEELAAIGWVLDSDSGDFEIADRELGAQNVVLRGLESHIRSHFDDIEAVYSNIEEMQLQIDAVRDPRLLASLRPSATGEQSGDDVEQVASWLRSESEAALESFSRRWLGRWAQVAEALFEARRWSLCEQMAPQCFDLGNRLNYTAFNFYCPECTRSAQEELLRRDYSVHGANAVPEAINFSANTRCVYRPEQELWRCLTCEVETAHPIPVHKMLDELVYPTYDRLMEEHKLERLKAHDKMRVRAQEHQNQLEGGLEKVRFENLSRILELSDEMERIHAEIKGEEEAIASMAEILDAYQIEKSQAITDIQLFSLKTEQQIGQRIQRVLGHVDEIQHQEMQALQAEMRQLAVAQRMEDEYRDRIQREILVASRKQVEVQQQQLSTQRELLDVNRDQLSTQNQILDVNRDQLSTQNQILDVNRDQLSTNERLLDESRKQTKVSEEGFSQMVQKTTQGNAIQAAIAKEQGMNVHDEGILRPFKKLKNFGSDVFGAVTTRATYETEAKKLS